MFIDNNNKVLLHYKLYILAWKQLDKPDNTADKQNNILTKKKHKFTSRFIPSYKTNSTKKRIWLGAGKCF